MKLYLLKGGVSKNFWAHFKTSTPSKVKVLRVIVIQEVRRAEARIMATSFTEEVFEVLEAPETEGV